MKRRIVMNPKHDQPLKTIGKWLVAIAIGTSIALAAHKLTTAYNIGGSLCTLSFVIATVVAIVYRLVNPYGWTLILSGLGYPTSAVGSVRIWLLSESNRWLPGGIWGYATRAVQATRLGVPINVASGSMLVELLVTLSAAIVVSLLGLLFYYERFSSTFYELTSKWMDGYASWGVAICMLAVCFGLAFVTRRKFYKKLHGLVERFQLLNSVHFRWRPVLSAMGYMVLMAGLNGCVNFSLLPAVGVENSVPMLVMIAATATAWIVGFLALFSPGGILVREATLAALLLPWLPYEVGIILAVLSRVAQLLAEVVCIALVFLFNPTDRPASGGLETTLARRAG
jgi:glycosyltransferase 2 family protein